MTITLTADQEALVRRALERGVGSSEEAVIDAALRSLGENPEPDILERTGMEAAALNRELERGLSGPGEPWEGADAFEAKLRAKYPHGRSNQ
ncbi:ribbon-helix-helix domain-containing protein [Jiella avicenniae]|uniref:Uncharacterized protein n=1 Tax=Jiella avicenniae TaxID=2907202 RepID=A0A9X1P344_9HYPH|nr:hypothetical protein [Jiella avicenniae]MCE7028979.1 hypothetical protein [Jiella avicenniae]